jgi:hypothetical protein
MPINILEAKMAKMAGYASELLMLRRPCFIYGTSLREWNQYGHLEYKLRIFGILQYAN